MTLDEMIQLTAGYINETITKDVTEYTGEELQKAQKVINAINFAYLKVCREKVMLEYKETVASGVDVNTLAKTLYRINKVIDAYGNQLDYSLDADILTFDDSSATLYYYYIPSNLTALTDTPLTPPYVDHKGFCFYAAFEYLMSQGRDYFSWLDLFNDFFDNLKPKRGNSTKRVINVYD